MRRRNPPHGARRRRNSRTAWQRRDSAKPFAELAAYLNADLKCGWCGFPARPYGGFMEEANAGLLSDVPGLPAGWRFAIHHQCLDPLDAAISEDRAGWRDRLWPRRIADGGPGL